MRQLVVQLSKLRITNKAIDVASQDLEPVLFKTWTLLCFVIFVLYPVLRVVAFV